MTAPLSHPVIPAADARQEIVPEAAVIFIDLDYWDAHKVATDARFVIRDGLNERRW